MDAFWKNDRVWFVEMITE